MAYGTEKLLWLDLSVGLPHEISKRRSSRLDGNTGTKATTRVLIESSDGEHIWRTVGCSTDIIEASWLALADALEYWLVVVHSRERAQMLA